LHDNYSADFSTKFGGKVTHGPRKRGAFQCKALSVSAASAVSAYT